MICNISGLFMTATYGQVYIWFAYVYVYICGYFPRCNSTLDERYYVLLNLNAMHVYLHCNLKKKNLYRKFQLSRYVKFVCDPSPRLGGVRFPGRDSFANRLNFWKVAFRQQWWNYPNARQWLSLRLKMSFESSITLIGAFGFLMI